MWQLVTPANNREFSFPAVKEPVLPRLVGDHIPRSVDRLYSHCQLHDSTECQSMRLASDHPSQWSSNHYLILFTNSSAIGFL